MRRLYLDLDRMQTFTTLSAAAQAAAVINNILNAENRDYLAAANSSIWFQNYMIPYDYDADTNKMYGWFSESFSGNWLGYPVVLTNVTRDNYALFSLISSPPKPPPPSPSESPPMTWLPLLLE